MTRGQQGMIPREDLPTRVRRRLGALHARTRYRLGLPELDPGEVSLARSFRHPIDSRQRELIATQYRELFPDAVRTELAEARRLAAHRFILLGHIMDHGERIGWSRDPVSGREWGRGFSPDIPYRGPGRLGDIKLPWELNKHQYFFTLGKAAWLADDPSLAIEIVRQIDHWIEDNPCHRGINWISALEAGTRAVAWIIAYPFYADRCDASFLCRLVRSLAQHMLFVEGHLSTGRFTNTHLIGEAAALVAGGLFVDCRYSRRWLERGLVLLKQEMHHQVTSDGVHAERSVAYHRFFLDHYYLVSGLLAANRRSLQEATCRGMERMTEFLMDVLCPDGSAPAFGDGDDARGLWFRADCPNDDRPLLALGAVLFGRGDFKAVAGSVTEEVLWLQGIDGVNAFQGLPARPPDHTSAAYADGGYYVMRGGWGAFDPILVFDCGPLGHGPAGHGHADALSFQLYAHGFPFLVDSGTFSYNLDYGWRDAFRSSRAHNTIVVDGQEQSVPGDRMSWKTMACTHCHGWLSTRWFDLADAEHDGYCRLPDPVRHRRIVVFVKPDTWWVLDRLEARGRHDLEFLLHLRPDCVVEAGEGAPCIVLRSPTGTRLPIWLLGKANEPHLPEILIGSEEERGAWFSPGYGTRVPTRALRFRSEFVEQGTLATCFSTSKHIVPTYLEQGGAFYCGIGRGEGNEEILFYRITTDWLAGVEGIRFDGQALYRRKARGRLSVLCAGRFRELSVRSLLEVRSPVPIESLLLEDNSCEVVLTADHPGGLEIAGREGLGLVINGRPVPGGAAVLRTTVT